MNAFAEKLKTRLIGLWRKRSTKWALAIFAALYVTYCGVTAYVVPSLVKTKAAEFVYEKFERKLEIADVSFNPVTMTVSVDGVRLSEHASNDTFMSLSHAEVSASVMSLLRFAPVLDAAEVTDLKVNLIRLGPNSYNIDDFIAFAMKPKEDDSPARFIVYDLVVKNAEFRFDDRPKGKKHVVDRFNVSIPYISSIPVFGSGSVDLMISGRVNGEEFGFSGEASPFGKDKDGSIRVKLDKIPIRPYLEYSPVKPAFDFRDGKISTDLGVNFKQPGSGGFGLTILGNFSLSDLTLATGKGAPAVTLPLVSVDFDKTDVLSGEVNIKKILIDKPDLNVIKEANGRLNLEQLGKFTAPPEPKGSKAKAPEEKKEPVKEEKKEDKKEFNLRLALQNFEIRNARLKFDDKTGSVPAAIELSDASLSVDNVAANLKERSASVEKVSSSSGTVKIASSMKQLKGRRGSSGSASGSSKGSDFNFLLKRFELTGWQVLFDNKTGRKAVKTEIKDIRATVNNVTLSNDPLDFAVAAVVNGTGKIDVSGKVGLQPLAGDIDVNLDKVNVCFVQPFIDEYVNLNIKKADLTVKGKMALRQARGGIGGTFTGDAALSSLATADKVTSHDFVGWRDLRLKGIRADLAPVALSVNEVALDGLNARVILNANGTLNLSHVLKKDGRTESLTEEDDTPAEPQQQKAATAHEEDKEEAEEQGPSKPPMKMSVKRFAMTGGHIDFTDNFVKPRYRANITRMNGAVTNLSSDPDTKAKVNFKAIVLRAPMTLSGEVNPLSGNLYLDIKAKVNGIQMHQFSSYTGKYIGYAIEKGRMSFDVAYRVKDGQLEAENDLVMHQLTLGEKIESPDAMNLPVHLALSLLKDRDGNIDISLPVSGTLNDPSFSVGGIIWKVFVNLITKAVTSPFNLLSSLIGSSEELSFAQFDPGQAVITPATEKRLTDLAKALDTRPGLNIEIAGRYDPVIDGNIESVKQMRKMLNRDSKSAVTKAEYDKLLADVYSDTSMKKPRNWVGMAKSLPNAEMEKMLGEHFAKNVSGIDQRMKELADRRSRLIREWLIEKGKISPERILVVGAAPKPTANGANGCRVDFILH